MNCYMPVTTVSSKGLCMYKLILIAAYTSTIQWNWIKNCLVTVFLLVDIRDFAAIIQELKAQQLDYTKWSELDPIASAPPHEVQDKCDEDKTHEVNSEMKDSYIFEEGIGKICYAHALLTHYCWTILAIIIILLSHYRC